LHELRSTKDIAKIPLRRVNSAILRSSTEVRCPGTKNAHGVLADMTGDEIPEEEAEVNEFTPNPPKPPGGQLPLRERSI